MVKKAMLVLIVCLLVTSGVYAKPKSEVEIKRAIIG